jgi:hypothetical protein
LRTRANNFDGFLIRLFSAKVVAHNAFRNAPSAEPALPAEAARAGRHFLLAGKGKS